MTTVNDDMIRAFLADEARRAMATAPSLDEAVGRLAPRIGGRPSGASQRLIVVLAATLLLVAALGTAIAIGSGILRLPLVMDNLRFTSTIHGISIDYPAGWQIRRATEPWTEGELNFDSPAGDVIFDPTLGDGLYLVLASQPLGGLSADAWRDGNDAGLCDTTGGHAGSPITVEGADAYAITCGGTASAALIFTDNRGYVIRLVVSSDEPGLAETYDWDWHKAILETVDLRPEEALDASRPSASP